MSAHRPRVLVVQNEHDAPVARVGRWLEERDLDLLVVRAYAGESLPALQDVDGVVVMGGSMGCEDDADNAWLPETRLMLSTCVAIDFPVMGVCLGAQMLAATCGGVVALGDTPEFGLGWIELTEAGVADSITGHLPSRLRVTQFHRDGISVLPDNAVVLATSELYPVQAFRLGRRVYAVQGHPEVDGDLMELWLDLGADDIVENSGRGTDEVIAEIRRAEDELERDWRPMFHAWADLVHESVGSVADRVAR